MKNFVEKLDHFFIHPKLHSNIEEYGRARILLYAMMMTTLFSASYSTYYELTHENIHIVKHVANIVGAFTGLIGMILLKFISKFKVTFFSMLVLADILVFTSTFFSGGIYSVDLLWMVIITMIGFLFVGNKSGIILLFTALAYFAAFFAMENLGIHNFAKDSLDLGAGYKLYNLIFLGGLASFITYFFVSGAGKIRKELDELKERHVKSLDYKYQHITENANEIIALHSANGDTTFISSAIKSILGYEAEELLGNKYALLLGEQLGNKELMCVSKDGREVWLELSYNPIKDEMGSGEVFISMARDISAKVLENQKITQLRKQIANDFHDEMGNKLAAITLNSNILSIKTKDNPEVTDIISKIESTSKSLYQQSRDFIWSIDAKSDELREIFSYLRDFGDDFFHSLPVNFLVESKGFSEQEKIILPMYCGRHIILIFKEALTNSAKHSKCKNVILSLAIEKDAFTISAKDDGKGISAEAKAGKGLNSIRERAKNIHCELNVVTDASGTKISLRGELPKMGEIVSSIQQ
ncbi:MAG: PAS domain S-box protein [Bacteroidetes bacterium]|nr:PAS domain S-box protein [Bacteroidota bacterium]